MDKLSKRQLDILNIAKNNEYIAISFVQDALEYPATIPTLNRDLASLVLKRFLIKHGKGRGITYTLSPGYNLLHTINVDAYFDTEPDMRKVKKTFDFSIFSLLEETSLFTHEELKTLTDFQKKYKNKSESLSPTLYKKELQRLTIELSWKSAQIEGNTYSLLETERLFLDKEEAYGKPRKDAIMLLNHQTCLELILSKKDFPTHLHSSFIEEVHKIIVKDLKVTENIRSRIVGITGTPYIPLDNCFQIKEALEEMCVLINKKKNGFEKALLAIALISYIQPFEDGNKHTARMISTVLLLQHEACPLSYRCVTPLEYKKAMLIFYEQNNLFPLKQLFLEQADFSAHTYFQ